MGYNGEGKRARRVVYGATKKEAQDKLRNLQVSGPFLGEAENLTVGEYLNRWLENTAKNKVRPTTYARYEQPVRLHAIPHLGGVRLARLGALQVEQFYADLKKQGTSAWTQKMAGVLLTNALRQAVRQKLIPYNPAVDVAKPRPEEHEMLYLEEAQAKRFLVAARPSRLYALFALAEDSGMRQRAAGSAMVRC
jgi:integrase